MIFCKQSFECYVTLLKKSIIIYICFSSLLQLDDTIIYCYAYLDGSGSFFYILSTRLLQTLICSFLLCPESRRCATQWSLTIHPDHSQSITCDHSAPVIWVSLEAIGPVGNRCLLKPVKVNHVKLKSECTLLSGLHLSCLPTVVERYSPSISLSYIFL